MSMIGTYPMPMAPNNSVYRANIFLTFIEYLVDVLGDIQPRYTVLDRIICRGGKVPPIFSTAKIEHDVFAQLLVLD